MKNIANSCVGKKKTLCFVVSFPSSRIHVPLSLHVFISQCVWCGSSVHQFECSQPKMDTVQSKFSGKVPTSVSKMS